ncbi:type II toxin-antitoxin system Phd/YefM family antitoxin [Geomonas sp.]|uniref:type II toxin-antitoxin system Phd/YefM family antitoxin n=1 Tax=Geomonas sp. TaxID=2651584 RepID=UPI002B45E8D3|nr:type II toxin-antitoxin system Phd/YefM family antitoxin [Geomonas sp.]HJV36907.1 type II toxin-antitoxin system Phd/YefM family antitoxin [Geomonas sp.]
MSSISANDLKTRGVSAIEAALTNDTEAVISVRGKNRFVVMPLEHFQYLRECELEAALAQTTADLAEGRFEVSTPEEHLKKIKDGGEA